MIKRIIKKIKDFFLNTFIYIDPYTGERLENKTEDCIMIKNNGYANYKRFINNDNIRSHINE